MRKARSPAHAVLWLPIIPSVFCFVIISWNRKHACREGSKKMENVRAAHVRYCERQLENVKTSRVLQSAFGEDFAKRYMSEIMFDAPAPQQQQQLQQEGVAVSP